MRISFFQLLVTLVNWIISCIIPEKPRHLQYVSRLEDNFISEAILNTGKKAAIEEEEEEPPLTPKCYVKKLTLFLN